MTEKDPNEPTLDQLEEMGRRLEEMRERLPASTFNKARDMFSQNVEQAQALEDGNIDGAEYRRKAMMVFNSTYLLALFQPPKTKEQGDVSPNDAIP